MVWYVVEQDLIDKSDVVSPFNVAWRDRSTWRDLAAKRGVTWTININAAHKENI